MTVCLLVLSDGLGIVCYKGASAFRDLVEHWIHGII